MKQALQLKLSQHLTLTPQLQQSIRLLQLSTLELNQEVDKFLLENPFLEREDAPLEAGYSNFTSGAGVDQFTTPDAPQGNNAPVESSDGITDSSSQNNADADWQNWSVEGSYGSSGGTDRGDEDSDYMQQEAESPSLRDHLNGQLSASNLSERDKGLVALLIDALDDDGYLTQPLEEVLEMLPAESEVSADELHFALKYLQQLEPTGIGGRNPAECLALQLEAMSSADNACHEVALRLVKNHLALLAAHDFAKLKKQLSCNDETLRTAQKLIMSLNPRPGSAYSNDQARYVVPDVVVKKTKNVWVVNLNQAAMPKLKINRLYADILQSNRPATGSQIASQLQEARWMIKNVQQRFETILRVSQAIVDRQRHFFDHGEVAMRPLVLREIADTLSLHESTVSRVTTQKYMLTPRGIFELKYFFGSHVSTETGGACSATAIRALIKQLVGSEDAAKPLSDSKISQILGQQGIVVARRTIAKYRESLHIPPVNLRKSL